MQSIFLALQSLFAFIIIISIIVFIHEFGHFIIARFCKVKIEEFSIGFGKEIFGFYDRHKTRWKFCLMPFGGYVKMYGDKNYASSVDRSLVESFSITEKKQAFIFKNVYQRFLIVVAGPVANFILAIIIITFLLFYRGETINIPIITTINPNSPAANSGLQINDEIIAINGNKINNFDDFRLKIIESGANKDVNLDIKRQEQLVKINIRPQISVIKNSFDEEMKIPIIGIVGDKFIKNDLTLLQSFIKANKECYNISISILNALGDLITGKRSIKELGGPIKIAKYSKKSFDIGILMVLWFMAMISINLGVMNLLPIPMLDGGHLLFYLMEMILKKPVPDKIQDYSLRIGFSILISLMIFTTLNDIYSLFS
jgi:regulator of sigma E protease